ncbi:SRPBCC family protein [Nocardioides lianchengensis]|uniref:Polyketide cyclase / dehydrase and lipid transport n=1 Tax=Nocardioides lianchengensis TaxID=1045774 RepID=A0A1G6KXF6_9ACTN|nr:SRPBCC family protein [Nocardioides lianchengensis]NYG13735.1 uncharacterized protein YndB with AHSA1/START domain [Nocardioides lianchengensis]SDC35762.1 Polyketide cyclase / dehydrase and lipid transport [Nocardioides lianchengensis]
MSSDVITATAVIPAPPSVVFAILADPRQHARIDGSGTVQGIVSGPERLSLDAEFGMSMKQGAPYKIKNRVVEFEEDRLIAWRHLGLHRWRYELAPVDGGTRVTESWDLTHYPRLLRPVMRALFGGRTQKAVDETLVRLARAAAEDAH